MPSISQAKLAELESYREALHDQRGEKAALEQRIRRFDDILDKIVRAANGQALNDRVGYNRGYDYQPMMAMEGGKPRKLSADERHEAKIESLNERIVTLESRLAAAAAVATFAKEHKG